MIHTFVPAHVGPSKLDLLLTQLPDICDESKTKVAMLIDINRLTKLMHGKIMSPKAFYEAYDKSVEFLEMIQHNLQVEYNTNQYRNTIQGADF